VTKDEEQAALYDAYNSLRDMYADTERLRTSDFELIGRMVQVFCVADFESRRIIEAIGDLGGKVVNVASMADKDVPVHLVRCGREWNGPSDIGAALEQAGDCFSKHQQVRHTLAHWAGRRIKGHDAYLFLATRLNHRPPEGWERIPSDDTDATAGFRVLLEPQLRRYQGKFEQHAQYLGQLSHRLEDQAATARKPGK